MSAELHEALRRLSRELEPQLVELRRAIHRRPELGFEEHETSESVASTLEEAGIEVQRGIAKTGVVGLIRGNGDGRCFAIRGDMDALPIHEETGLPFASERQGVMHACGHDGNTTITLGAGLMLHRLRDRWSGTIKLIFQPAEESAGGAVPMIEAGVLHDPSVDAAIAIHVDTGHDSGTVSLRYGEHLAAADRFEIEVTGRGTHGAMPDKGDDSILAAAQIIVSLQQIVSRRVNPVERAVVTVGSVHGGSAFNIIPERVELVGTVRTLSEETREQIESLLPEIAGRTAAAHGCRATVTYQHGAPVLVHDEGLTRLAEETLSALLGPEGIALARVPCMGAEDFAFFAERVPATQLAIGCTRPGSPERKPFHHPSFDIDEECLASGACSAAAVALAFLGGAE